MLLVVLAGCGTDADATPDAPPLSAEEALALESEARERAQSQPREDLAADTAIFAGGCFWCMEPPFDRLDGVHSTTSGFIGGHVENPSYEEVTTMRTGHIEAVQVVFDPAVVDYGRLLEVYWRNVDPLDNQGQFCDRGPIYRPAIFPRHAEQEALALASRRELEESGRFDQPIVVEITEASRFWPAEEYHQGFYLKNPDRYQSYRRSCGRDQRLEELWGEELR
ncbi:MAG: peptide-methionine (S)-S-oxide reductase [Gemmatimonadales bacterium]|nr:MAG: peptide-methionine (S)-S-oxide reductase [Gemmatimonadales bacterium]